MITFLKAWKIWRGACPEVQRARILPEPGTDCAARFRLSSWRCVARGAELQAVVDTYLTRLADE